MNDKQKCINVYLDMEEIEFFKLDNNMSFSDLCNIGIIEVLKNGVNPETKKEYKAIKKSFVPVKKNNNETRQLKHLEILDYYIKENKNDIANCVKKTCDNFNITVNHLKYLKRKYKDKYRFIPLNGLNKNNNVYSFDLFKYEYESYKTDNLKDIEIIKKLNDKYNMSSATFKRFKKKYKESLK